MNTRRVRTTEQVAAAIDVPVLQARRILVDLEELGFALEVARDRWAATEIGMRTLGLARPSGDGREFE